MAKKKLTYIDLFAGCGGLSLGLEAAGFSLELAVEKSDMAAETFYHNFIQRIADDSAWKQYSSEEKSIEDQAKSKLIVKELSKLLECEGLLKDLRKKNIDLIAGGPPCQGFSMAGRRNPKDSRNQLPWQFLDLVEAIAPKAVLIENVAGMRQNFTKHEEEAPFEQLRIALSQIGQGYFVQPVLLNAKHYGVPQHRPRVMLLGIRKDIGKILGIKVSETTWKSEYDEAPHFTFPQRPTLAPKTTHCGKKALSVKDAIWDLTENTQSKRAPSEYVKTLREYDEVLKGVTSKNKIPNHTYRKHADIIKTRFRLHQYLRDNDISSRILRITAKSGANLEAKTKMVKEFLSGAKFPAKLPDGYILAKNVDELAKMIIALSTKKHSQRPLNWELPSPTIVSLPDDFVHPSEPRTMTVREMARIQSFPDAFEFRAKETTGSMRRRFEVPQYTQVGNAVPPKLAEAVGKVLFEALSKYSKKIESLSLEEAV